MIPSKNSFSNGNSVASAFTGMTCSSRSPCSLKNATPNSLVLLDEVGRGTSTYDGLSIAWSVIEYISKNKDLKCKTLFATHYHELTKLEGIIEGVKNYSVAVKETDEQVIFLRKIVEGGADQSYGIEVAKLAGLPLEVIERAKHILAKLENEKSIEIDKLFNNYKESEKVIEAAVTEQSKSKVVEIKEEPITEPVIEEKVKEEVKVVNEPIQVKESNEILQMDFTMLEKESLLNEIADIEVMTMTPLDAMNKLFKIVQDAKKLK